MKKVVAHGVFDLFHYGHLNYLENAKSFGDYLIVLVSSDKISKKHGKNNFFQEDIRCRILRALEIVDEVIIRNELMVDALNNIDADVFVTTDSFLKEKTTKIIPTILVERTEAISSTLLKEKIIKQFKI